MPVPPVSRFLAPTLRAVSDGKMRSVDDLINIVAWHFELSDEDRRLRTGGGTNTQLRDRVNWTVTYLAKAALVTRPKPKYVQITSRGQKVMQDFPPGEEMDVGYLMQFPEFREWKGSRDDRRDSNEVREEPTSETRRTYRGGMTLPSRAISSKSVLQNQIAEQLRQLVAGLDALAFQQLVESFLVASGCRDLDQERSFFRSVDPQGDAFGVVGLDALGLARVLVHAIQSEKTITSGTIHRFAREMSLARCRFGLVIAQHEFASEAREAHALLEKDVVLIDGDDLARRLAERMLGRERDGWSGSSA